MPIIIGTGNRYMHGFFIFILTTLSLVGCNSSSQDEGTASAPVIAVKITPVTIRDIELKEVFPATVVYLNKSNMDASLSGYLQNLYVQTGDYVEKEDLLFKIETREHAVIASDTGMHYNGLENLGVYTVKSPASGYIAAVSHQQGDYVQEGSTICLFTRDDQLYVKAFLPIGLKKEIKAGQYCRIKLPDGLFTNGSVVRILNELDPASQSLQVLTKSTKRINLAENLNLMVELTMKKMTEVMMVPASAILSSEKLDHFWVMKMLNDSTAIKTPVVIGIRLNDSVQIVAPPFKANTKLISEGNYGLADTAKVEIAK